MKNYNDEKHFFFKPGFDKAICHRDFIILNFYCNIQISHHSIRYSLVLPNSPFLDLIYGYLERGLNLKTKHQLRDHTRN